jgi:deoxyribodipyrimidine photo-lyase
VRHACGAVQEIPALAHELDVQAVFANRDDEPDALERDAKVLGALANAGVTFHTYKDSTVFDRDEVMTKTGQPYTVFTPYKRAWLAKVDSFFLKSYPVRSHADALRPAPGLRRAGACAARDIGFEKTNLSALEIPTGTQGAGALFEDFFERIDRYDDARNFPAVRGPSYMGVHLRFGTVSIRQLASVAHQLSLQGNAGAATWLSELIWRDFYFQILAHFPHVHTGGESKSFRPEYDKIQWHHGKHADSCSRPGAKAARATRWWTRPCCRSTRAATCTTACAWWSPAS